MIDRTIKKEAELLLLCSSVKLNHKEKERINKLCSSEIDWSRFIELAFNNRVHVLVFNSLKKADSIKGRPLFEDFKKKVIITSARSLFLETFLKKLLYRFKRNKIFAMPFKGPALSEKVYGDSTFRYFSDLDIIVYQGDALRALKLLKQSYTAHLDLNESQLKKYIADEDHFAFFDPASKVTIELHWDLTGLYLSDRLTVSRLKGLLDIGLLDSLTIPCLSKECLLVYLCIHGAKHGWENLEQLCLVSEILKAKNNIDWEIVKTLSTQWRCRKMVNLGLYMASRYQNAPLPDTVLNRINSDKSFLVETADKIINNMFNQSYATFSNRFSFFHLKVRDNFIDKIRYGSRLLFRPTDKEWLYYPLPASLSFLHYLLRPLRLLNEKIRTWNA